MFLHSQFKTNTNIPKQTLYIFPKTILSINISEIYKKNAYMCTINNCKINSATLITIYTNLVKTKILQILDLISLFFYLISPKKRYSLDKFCVNFAFIKYELSKKAYKGKTRLAPFVKTHQLFRTIDLD